MSEAAAEKRDQAWLQGLLDRVWDEYFADVPQENDVRIEFGRRAKRRLGSIRIDPKDRRTTIITMNGLFRFPEVPDFIIEATLVHELTHYAHGFNSPLEQQQAHPHAGGVMRREFEERGLLELYLEQKRWLKSHWYDVVGQYLPTAMAPRPVTSSRSSLTPPKPFWFLGER